MMSVNTKKFKGATLYIIQSGWKQVQVFRMRT